MSSIWAHLTISWSQALALVFATTVLYVVVTLVLRRWGRRLMASSSTLSMAVSMFLGAVAARAALGDAPRLVGGLVVIGVVLVLEAVLAKVGAGGWATRLGWHHPPEVVMEGAEVREDVLARHRISSEQLAAMLRRSGVTDLDRVAYVILEPRASLTIIQHDDPIDPRLFADVQGLGLDAHGS